MKNSHTSSILVLHWSIEVVFQYIAGLAVQGFANGFQGGEADGFGFAGFEDGKVAHSYAHLFRKLGEAHFSFGQHNVQVYDNGHALHREFLLFKNAFAFFEDIAEYKDEEGYHEEGIVKLFSK